LGRERGPVGREKGEREGNHRDEHDQRMLYTYMKML
jgi:hypothetical protein